MELQPSVKGILYAIADGVVADTLSWDDDYGRSSFLDRVRANDQDGADDVLAFLNGRVSERTGAEMYVAFADPKHFTTRTNSGLTLALVPYGESADSPNAKLFGIAGGGRVVAYSSKRASQADIEEWDRREVESSRRRAQEVAGKQLQAQLTEKVRDLVLDIDAELGRTTVQRDDRDYVLRNSGGRTSSDRIRNAKLDELFTLLSIYGDTDLSRIL